MAAAVSLAQASHVPRLRALRHAARNTRVWAGGSGMTVQTQQWGVCRRHGNHMPCDPCEQRSASLRRAWTTDRRLQFHRHHMAQRESSWQPDELAILHECAGRESGSDILMRVNAWRTEYGLAPRSLDTLYRRAHEAELYLKPGDVTPASRLARLCGVHIKTVTLWRVEGYLTGRPWGPNHVYTDSELESARSATRPARGPHSARPVAVVSAGSQCHWPEAVLCLSTGHVRRGRGP
jgi:hypothetical protein